MLNRLSDVAFWPHRSDRDTASFRVRCAAIVDGLRRHGVAARFYQPGDPPPAVLVMSKRYDAQSVAHAQALRHAAGTRWALDLCDNHFLVPPDALPGDKLAVRAARLIAAVQAADWVITSSEPLRREIEGRVPPVRGVSVIEDAVDEIAQPSGAAGPPALRNRLQFGHQRLFELAHRAAPGRRLVWFGNHAAHEAGGGIDALIELGARLNRHHAQAPLTLTVISNHREKYHGLRTPWRFPSIYQDWSTGSFAALVARHDVAIVPAHPTPFGICKSSNRLVTAFSLGVAVAAGAIPAYEPFRGLAVLDDWEEGLQALMDDAGERARRVQQAKAIIASHYTLDVISGQWAALIRRLATEPAAVASASAR